MVSNGRLLQAIDAACKACLEPLGSSSTIENCQCGECPLWPVRRGSSQRQLEKPLRILGKEWTQAEDRKLLAWANKGKSKEWIATQLFRSPLAVEKRMADLLAGDKLVQIIIN